MTIKSILQILNAVLLVFSLLLILRILLTWFRLPSYGKAWEVLCRVTEPYLSLFRNIRFLRRGVFDFSPLAAILVLIILQNIINQIIIFGRITLGLVLSITLLAIWANVLWILLLFSVICVVRIGGLVLAKNSSSPIWPTLDRMVQPFTKQVDKIAGQTMDYRISLLLSVVGLVLIVIAGTFLINTAAVYINRLIPI